MCRQPEGAKHLRERVQALAGARRGKTNLWIGTDPRAKRSVAGAAASLGDFPPEAALGRGKSHQMGERSGSPQEILPEVRPQPAPHLFELAAPARHRPSMGGAAVSQISSFYTAIGSTVASPGSLQDPHTGKNCLLGFQTDVASVSTIEVWVRKTIRRTSICNSEFGQVLVEIQQFHTSRFCWWRRQTLPGIFG